MLEKLFIQTYLKDSIIKSLLDVFRNNWKFKFVTCNYSKLDTALIMKIDSNLRSTHYPMYSVILTYYID